MMVLPICQGRKKGVFISDSERNPFGYVCALVFAQVKFGYSELYEYP